MPLGAMESSRMFMEIPIKGSGLIIRLTVMGYFRIKIKRDMKVNGRQICHMGKGRKLGKTEALTMEIMSMELKKAKESTF